MAEMSLMRWMIAKDLYRRGKCDKVCHPHGYCTAFPGMASNAALSLREIA